MEAVIYFITMVHITYNIYINHDIIKLDRNIDNPFQQLLPQSFGFRK